MKNRMKNRQSNAPKGAMILCLLTICIYLDNVNPFLAIYAAVTRSSDKGVFMPEQAVSVIEALKMWTIWAARSMCEADVKGAIEPGKYADMTVLSDDIFTMPKEGLKDVKVLKTIVGGNVVYEAKQKGVPRGE
jgi:predicted amidohydrolase YtcJ